VRSHSRSAATGALLYCKRPRPSCATHCICLARVSLWWRDCPLCQLQATCALAAGSSSLLLHDPATTCAAIIHCCYARGRRIKPDLVWEWSTAEHLCERIRYAQCAVIQDPLPQVLCCTASVLDLHVQHIVFALRECPCGGEIVLCLD
jgi:hypothetical protein